MGGLHIQMVYFALFQVMVGFVTSDFVQNAQKCDIFTMKIPNCQNVQMFPRNFGDGTNYYRDINFFSWIKDFFNGFKMLVNIRKSVFSYQSTIEIIIYFDFYRFDFF
eukprot:TRINITY_DN20450_c1_g1_i1.p4 TRINITY_DN20450_c1_g1~~TRINITY_DN20450_c1_g1_i1.p4  ORF type:complete len:107 (-),score=1.95 TRINITY_DN20450_c1_g1_i1:849-1169(-)